MVTKAGKKAGTSLMVPASDEALAKLRQDYPTELGFNRVLLPRLSMASQDVTEGKGKTMKVVTEAGTFFMEKQTDEVNEETGQKEWEKTELGTEVEGTILYQRKQLKFYDEGTEKYTSSPVYDNEDEVIPLFLDKKEVDRGTPKELKSRKMYAGVNAAGKAISKLEDNRILYVLVDDEIFQLNLRGSSMYSFLTWSRKILPPSVLTKFSSEAKEKGSIEWNMMTFEAVRPLTQEDVNGVLEKIAEIKTGIEQEKAYYAQVQGNTERAEGESDEDYKARKDALKKF